MKKMDVKTRPNCLNEFQRFVLITLFYMFLIETPSLNTIMNTHFPESCNSYFFFFHHIRCYAKFTVQNTPVYMLRNPSLRLYKFCYANGVLITNLFCKKI